MSNRISAAVFKKQEAKIMLRAYYKEQITIGFHPDGYRIDKTASPLNRYTRWDVLEGCNWRNPKPVCFDSLPKKGWVAKDRFDWDRTEDPIDITV